MKKSFSSPINVKKKKIESKKLAKTYYILEHQEFCNFYFSKYLLDFVASKQFFLITYQCDFLTMVQYFRNRI